MIKDLKISKLKLKSVQINDVFVDDKYVTEFITDIEIESSYFRCYINGTMTFSEELFSLSIGKSPETLKNDTLTFYFSDESEKHYIKKFVITQAIKIHSPSKNMWSLSFIDYYGKILLSSDMTVKITKRGYTGKPLEIVEDTINDLIERYDDCDIKFIRNNVYFINDNNVNITHRFVNDKTPLDNIKHLCDMYNIHMYQDNKCLYFIQNPSVQNLEVLTHQDGTELYTETTNNNYYEYKICDKIKQNKSLSTLDRVNYKISTNVIGKKHTYSMLSFGDFLSIVLLNNNVHDYRDFINSDISYIPSSVKTLSMLVYDNYCKYLKANTLIIYCRSNFEKVEVGTVVSVKLRSDNRFAQEREKGDVKYSGNWLITSSTIKIIDNIIFYRLRLNRFDNQKDLDVETNLISDGEINTETDNIEEILKKREALLEEKR